MTTVTLRGVPVDFPFEPYDLQKDYMDKVLECLQNETNGVLESPTGTGKTLSLLCSTLAWLQLKKAQMQAQRQTSIYEGEDHGLAGSLLSELTMKVGTKPGATSGRAFLGLPTVIYASRTHSQLSQAMNELKRTSYRHMKACILGSREQLCVHPEVMKETTNSSRVQLCRLKVKTRACHFYNRVERKKEDPLIAECSIMDIEDLVKAGNLHKFCPYYMAKELQRNADIIFMPYNYLLDPKIRKALGVTLSNNVVILDEAHNIERICEEAASIQIKSTDVTLAIEEVTTVMKSMSDEVQSFNEDAPVDFTADELCILKQMLLDFETAFDAIPINGSEGTTLDGNYIYKLFEEANIKDNNFNMVINLIEKIVQFLVTTSDGPFQRRGNGLQLFSDLLVIAFTSSAPVFKAKVQKCYKLHVELEEPKQKRQDNWLSKATSKSGCRILNYWCFSPGFGMNMLMDQGIRCVILTSGTLAPLKPLISELELTVNVRLENPHVVTGNQICVKIVSKGPDGVILNCNYQNRDNPAYIQSLGSAIVNITRQVPSGLLIFFSSYPIMQKLQQSWQSSGLWSSLNSLKPIYVEPREKEAFNSAMTEFYAKVNDPVYKGAIFMGVCRGKVSEGLDFADANGRAVLVTGLPFPPLKDPRVILKKRYLDVCNAKDREFLRGDEWYNLEACRAVNQAIGRVIRHQHDYGAILLMDSRFNNPRVKLNLSMWLREHVKVPTNFGEIVRDLRMFFKTAQSMLPEPKEKPSTKNTVPSTFDTTNTYSRGNFDFSSNQPSTSSQNIPSTSSNTLNPNGTVAIHKRTNPNELFNNGKRKKITVLRETTTQETSRTEDSKEYINLVKKMLGGEDYGKFVKAVDQYKNTEDLERLKLDLDIIFLKKYSIRYLLMGLEKYIRSSDKENFMEYVEKMP